MKKLFILLFVLSFVQLSKAQWVVDSFDNGVGPASAGAFGLVWADTAVHNHNFYAEGTNPQMDLSNSSDAYEGTGSMKIDYRIEAYAGWGGYCVRTNYHDSVVDSLPFIDLSTGTYLKFRYKVLTPADTSKAGSVFMEFKLAEYGETGGGGRDVWYHHNSIDLFDASGTWKEVVMPLQYNSDNTKGFSNQFADGDGELQWDKIKGFELALVYITSGGSVNTPAVTGSFLMDKLELVGNRYNPFQTFDNAATDVFTTDFMDWAGSTGKGSIALSNNTTDFVEGTGSLQLDYTVNASQDWGGYINMTDTTWALPDSFTNRTALVLYVKNVNPLTGTTPERVTFRFFLMENSTGANEDWICEVPINFEQAGEWTRYYLPLVQDTVWHDTAGHGRFPQKGFAQPWWSETGDKIFNQGYITGYKIEFSAGGNEYGPKGEIFTGRILFDVLQQSGFKFDDVTAPDAPVVSVIPSTNSNLVTWAWVPGESGETYSVYYSKNPITNIEADGVDWLAQNIAGSSLGGPQVFEHVLRSANVNRDKTFYYAVTCKDFAGNVGAPGSFGPVTNTAKGVTTVSINPPNPFVADGNLSEWAAIPSFVMQSALGTANVPSNYIVDGDADLSADVKVALDQNYLYVMMDVTDDVYNHQISNRSFWERDEPDLYIGLYNFTKNHVAYGTGATADYQIRFDEEMIRLDAATDDSALVPRGENYFHDGGTMKFPSGYLLEARIPLVDLATKRNPGSVSNDVINWKVGDMIPFTIGINDNDGKDSDANGVTEREGMIFYYPQPTEQAYQNVSTWGHTWIGDEVTGVEDNSFVVSSFDLKQNYPNPFNPSTKIQYSIAEAGLVSIKVFDILGRQIAELVNQQQSAGSYTVDFDAQNLSAGVYLYKIDSGSFSVSKKMILMK